MHAIVMVLLAGLAINSHKTGGVSSASEAYSDVKAGIEQGYSKDKFTSFKLND